MRGKYHLHVGPKHLNKTNCVSTQWCTAHCTQTTHCPKNTVQPLSDPQQWHLTMKH